MARQESLESIERLHADFAGPLYLYAWRRVGDRRLAEEAVQDTLVRAWRHAGQFDPDRGSLPAWLFTIAKNATTDQLRRRGARPDASATLDEAAPPTTTTDGDIDRAIEAWQLADALHDLSEEHREAIIEVHYLGYTVREVAERHDLPVGTVKSRVYYGLRALRLRLEEKGVTG